MTMNYSLSCEPLRAWNRLELRCRTPKFDRALKAEVHDPLWLLARQWQFGEFKGEDTGSAIFAKVEMEISKISKVQGLNQSVTPYSDVVPLETRVEQEPVFIDLRTCAQIGQQWFKFLEDRGAQYNSTSPSLPYQPHSYEPLFLAQYPMQLPVVAEDETVTAIDKAKILSQSGVQQFLAAMAGRSFDGVAWFHAILQTNPAANTLPPAIRPGIDPQHRLWVTQTATDFVNWFRQLYQVPDNPGDLNWNSSQLEYQFSCSLPNKNAPNTVLRAEEYYQGSLDWFAFDVDSRPMVGSALTQADPASQVETRVLTMIPTEARFGGMPRPRWWEFEDSYLDLGNIQADTTDIAKILLSQFALEFSNDWFVIPCEMPVGSFTRIRGIVVTDVFGQRTLIEPAGRGAADEWSRWSMYNLSVRENNLVDIPAVDNRLFIPPGLARSLEGEPVEQVRFLRDEMANMIWAVETRVPGLMGGGQDGLDVGRDLRQYLESLVAETGPAGGGDTGAALQYSLGNEVPEHWIPFIPLHLPGQNRSIQLQRGSMPRRFRNAILPIRPRTQILRPGLRDNQTQAAAYYIYEEEVPRAGVQVDARYQRSRWYHGTLFTWLGRRKTTGQGEGGSGLRFDRVSEKTE